MDIGIFEKQLCKAYSQSKSAFTLEECRDVFTEYFKAYRAYTGKEHPPLKTDLLVKMLNDIDGRSLVKSDDRLCSFEPEVYPGLIEQYFDTHFENCDRNICHFFSGKIRALRYFESCY